MCADVGSGCAKGDRGPRFPLLLPFQFPNPQTVGELTWGVPIPLHAQEISSINLLNFLASNFDASFCTRSFHFAWNTAAFYSVHETCFLKYLRKKVYQTCKFLIPVRGCFRSVCQHKEKCPLLSANVSATHWSTHSQKVGAAGGYR